MKSLPPDKDIILPGDFCAYCGVALTPETRQREHVVGRKFTPHRALERNWNLQVQSCASCNSEKADLEDDISAITQSHAADLLTPEQLAHLQRKRQGAFSRRTKKPVADSAEQMNVSGRIGNAKLTFGFTGPPQIAPERAFRLAEFHAQGFFHWITYQKQDQRGYFWPGNFMPIAQAAREDWGNTYFRGFAAATRHCPPRVTATTAQGFFKLWIKRNGTDPLWSFAVEWNRAARVIGLFGDAELGRAWHETIPKNEHRSVRQPDGSTLTLRTEVPLPEAEDELFCPAIMHDPAQDTA